MTETSQSAGPESVQQVPLASVLTDAACQARVQIRPSVVRDYRRAMAEQISEDGLRFPPIVLFTDGQHHWLADGFHRILAARDAGLIEFPADVRPGTEGDALLFSIASNGAHGLPRTNADKRKAVTLLLADAEWSERSDSEIARHCQVSLASAMPYCGCCPRCNAKHPGRANPVCQLCGGRGWLSQRDFELCPASERNELQRMRA
jgi:hypothetical protein